MQAMAPQIIEHMRTQLHNSKIEMKVRAIEASEAKRAYSRVEQFQMMIKKNPALQKMKEALGLELD